MELLTPVLRSIVGGNGEYTGAGVGTEAGDALRQLLAFWASGALSMRAQAQAAQGACPPSSGAWASAGATARLQAGEAEGKFEKEREEATRSLTGTRMRSLVWLWQS